jgi:hypothetical protein
MTTSVLPSALRRLRAMDAAELRFRATSALRNAVDRARASVSPLTWDRRELVLHGEGLEDARHHLARADWRAAHGAIADYLRRRPARFPVTPSALDAVATVVRHRFGDSAARRAADRILEGRYDLLGYRDVAVGTSPDWHRDPVNDRTAPRLFWDAVPYLDPACGDHKVTWELNRHQHFLTLGRAFALTGDRRYYQEFVRQLESWVADNPPLQGVNWSSMLELAFRSLSWLWALHFCAGEASTNDEQPWLVDLLLAMDRQLLHVEHNLSKYFSPNTHLTGEALALYVVGRVLPELGQAESRAAAGRAVLLDEASRQVNDDGGHAELSAHYHRYSTDFYLFALSIARLTGDPSAPLFERSARAQAAYLRTFADDRGALPLIGDDDGGQFFPICGCEPADARESLAHAAVILDDPTLAVDDVPEATYWFCGLQQEARPVGQVAPWPSRSLASSGYCVSRNDRGDHLVFDCGAHGFLNGGHAHSDALAIVLTAGGIPLLVDPGTATYTMDSAVRDLFRSTAMHNTVLVNGRPQSEPRGPFHWASATNARGTAWKTRPGMDYAEGRHDGFAPLTHVRRVLALHGIGWIVVDHLTGPSQHVTATAMWHFHPAWTVGLSSERVADLRGPKGTRLGLASSAPLAHCDSAFGQYAPVYGRIQAAPCLAATAAGVAPLALATFIPASAEWTPLSISHRLDANAFDILTAGGTLIVTSTVELEPVVEIKAGLAQTVHRD